MFDFDKISKELNGKIEKLPIDKTELEKVIDILFYNVLFPICKQKDCNEKDGNNITEYLKLAYDILFDNSKQVVSENEAIKILDFLFNNLSLLQNKLYLEANNFYNNDPAAKSIEEIIITYPGFFALTVYRISHELLKQKLPIIPRVFSEYAHSKVGIDIHPGAEIGNNFFIDHGTGIVIGESTIIGNNVKIYQGVTLGALSVTKDLANIKRHPTIEDNVVIYAGATILGGNTIIGYDSIIGGNVWITKSVPPKSVVYYDVKMQIKNNKE